jgi:hypothetical protein
MDEDQPDTPTELFSPREEKFFSTAPFPREPSGVQPPSLTHKTSAFFEIHGGVSGLRSPTVGLFNDPRSPPQTREAPVIRSIFDVL